MSEKKDKNLAPRPPIVVVMGHVDHGKTALLDFIRKTNVIAKEAGGITQSIGAYEIEHSGKKITFIDTPGHEAFSKMRTRGAKVADLGILVIAADESVKMQTKEAIKILTESKTPFIVAVNKIDKTNADIEKVKQELMTAGVLLEGFGGNISWHAISAKTGEGINELLDLILLAAEMESLTYNPGAGAKGVIIESKMDSRRGLSAVVVVTDGILKTNDAIATQSASGKVKILENFLGERVEKISPSSPALIIGFESLPQVGEEFFGGENHSERLGALPAKEIKEAELAEIETDKINLIVKADVSGSLEAISGILKTFPIVRIISESVGDITDNDVKSAQNTKAIIVAFKTRINKEAESLAKTSEVKIIASEIIYDLLERLEAEFKLLEKPVISNELEILAVFGEADKRQIVGGRVNMGIFKNNSEVKIQRRDNILGEAKIVNLQRKKQDVGQVAEKEECGMLVESGSTIKVGDKLIY